MKTRHSSVLATAAAGLMAAAMLLAPGARAAAPPSESRLAAAATSVEKTDIPGTSWAVHPKTGTLRITADSTVDAAELARLRNATARYGDTVVIERTHGTLRPYVSGGSSVYSGGWRCFAGFNVHSGSTYYFLTAGHCADGGSSWYADPSSTVYIGPTVGSSFPGNDYALVRYDNTSVPHPSDIRNANGVVTQITQAGNPTVGQPVCTTNDRMTTVECGHVTAVNATVNYGGGNIVTGMAQTNVCSEAGWSGSPLFSGTTALGILSGGSGNCSTGGTTFFQPVTEALSAYGVTV